MVAMMATCVIASAYQKPPEKVSTFLQPNTFNSGKCWKGQVFTKRSSVCMCLFKKVWLTSTVQTALSIHLNILGPRPSQNVVKRLTLCHSME